MDFPPPRKFFFNISKCLVAALALGTACAAGRGRPVGDKEAIREARQPDQPEHFASGRAYQHYLRARLYESRGEFRQAANQLKEALLYDDTPYLRATLGELYARVGLLERAEEECKRALALVGRGGSSPEAHLLLGKIYAAQKRRDRAITELRAAIAGEKKAFDLRKARGINRPPDPDPWRLLGAIYLEASDEENAAKTFEELSQVAPGDGGGFREMGKLFLERRDTARAERYLRRALEKDSADHEAHRRLAQMYESLRKPEQARIAYEAILRLDSEDGEALLALGKLSLKKGDAPAAQAYFKQLMAVAGDDISARVSIAFVYLDAKRASEAIAFVEEPIKRGDADGRIYFVHGIILQDQKRWAEAASSLAKVRAEEGEIFTNARANLAFSLAQLGKHAEAVEVLQEPLSLRPQESRLVTMLAYVIERAGRPGEAIALLERAIAGRERDAAAEDFAELYEALAGSLEKAGRVKDAIVTLRKAIAKRPKDESLLYSLGAALEKSGDTESAVSQMRAIVASNPDHADALNFIGYTYADRAVRLDEAEQLVKRALELKPENGFFLDSLGWVYFKKGEFARAVEALERAEKIAGPEPTILEHLGDAYRAAKKPSAAATAYRRALKLYGESTAHTSGAERKQLEQKLKELPESSAQN